MQVASAVSTSNAAADAAAGFAARDSGDAVEMELRGAWIANRALPEFATLRAAFEQQRRARWRVVAGADFSWDSQCATRLFLCARYCAEHSVAFDCDALPEGLRKLLALATAIKPQSPPQSAPLTVGRQLLATARRVRDHVVDFLRFIGELSLALLKLARGSSNARLRDFFYFVEQCGPQALAIVALISVLVGMILAYLGSVQLRQFGAEVYVANLVGIGMMREMGALMTAVIMAGRTGAAYAAQLGAMQANEEIDAITTLGMSPMEYLVVPRFLALLAVMPLLCIFSDMLGLIGGALVATGMDVNSAAFFHQVREAVQFDDIFAGLIKSAVFAALIAIAGCQAGLQSGRSSSAVGQATTRAVVDAIVYLVVADASLNILYDKIGF